MINSKELIKNIWRPEPDLSKRSKYLRFERNERTTLFSNMEFHDIISTLTPYDLVAYGELEPFYEKICGWLRIERGNVLLTSGSDAGIKAIFETFIENGDEVLVTLPNYAMFSAYTKMFGGKEVKHFYEEDLTFQVKSFLKKINSNTRLVIISNPGHTGSVISKKNIIRIIKEAKIHKSIILIDEAYHHFYNQTMIEEILNYENLIISRTFSKAFGLASIRVGLLAGSKKIIHELYKVKLVHEITGVAAKIGGYMLDNMNIVDRYVQDVNQGKRVLYNRLKKNNFEVLKSEANFVYFRSLFSLNVLGFLDFLKENKILIKGPFTNKPFNNHLRITVGDKDQMNKFCDSLETYLNSI